MLIASSKIFNEGFDEPGIHVCILLLALNNFRHQRLEHDVVEAHRERSIRLSGFAGVNDLEICIKILSIENGHQPMDLTKEWPDSSVQNKPWRQDEW